MKFQISSLKRNWTGLIIHVISDYELKDKIYFGELINWQKGAWKYLQIKMTMVKNTSLVAMGHSLTSFKIQNDCHEPKNDQWGLES